MLQKNDFEKRNIIYIMINKRNIHRYVPVINLNNNL